MKRRILWLGFLSLGFALEAGAVTYDYYLQVQADPQFGLAAWTATWTSNTLNPPTIPGPQQVCSAGPLSPFLVGAPMAGFIPFLSYCTYNNPSPTPVVDAEWAGPDYLIAYAFTFTTPPFTTGVFSASSAINVTPVAPPFPVNQFSGPNATLTITKAVSFPPIPRWLGSIARVSLQTVAGPVTPPAGSPVEAIVGFVDLNGNPIGQFPPVSIIPGQVSTFELDPGTAPVAFGHHTTVVPVVSAPAGQVLPPLQLTTEVLDSLTGYGALLTTATGLASPPASFSPQGLAPGQVMRLTATTAIPIDPCIATLSFANAQGVPVGPSLTVNLSPGQSQSLDLTSAMLNVPLGKSFLVQPMVALQVPIGAAPVGSPACMVSSDVFDVITNRTWTYQVANVQ